MDINNLPLLKYMAQFNKPIVLSTGMANLGEIEQAVNTIESQGNKKIVILHCISIYPPDNKDINLNNIKMLQDVFEYPVGFSDHTTGYSIPLASVALGTCIIEKHFTIDRSDGGVDSDFSLEPNEFENLVVAIGKTQNILGSELELDENEQRFSNLSDV